MTTAINVSAPDELIGFAVICARYRGKWIFCRHESRATWEIPGGHREAGESVEAAARRELYEETGAAEYRLAPIGVYSVDRGGSVSYGGYYFAEVYVLGELPGFEIKELRLFDSLPDELTYPQIQPMLFHWAEEFCRFAKLQIGMPSLVEAPSPEETAKLASSLGLDFAELNLNLPECQKLSASELKRLMKTYSLYFTLHLDEQLDVGCFNPRVADAWLESFVQSLRLARNIGAPVVNMHLPDGVYFTLPDRKVYLYERDSGHYRESLSRLIDAAERELDENTLVCIENTNAWKPFQLRGIETLLRNRHFALTLDIGHSASCGRADEPFILGSGRLCHMHLHDASGKSNHLPLGTGELDLAHCFGLAKENSCRAVIEVKTEAALADSIEYIRKRELIK